MCAISRASLFCSSVSFTLPFSALGRYLPCWCNAGRLAAPSAGTGERPPYPPRSMRCRAMPAKRASLPYVNSDRSERVGVMTMESPPSAIGIGAPTKRCAHAHSPVSSFVT